ncbi:LemA family protein [Candidatus Peregrinibacteria bacterium]|nr:LemA family protein [Candidatus Peregrinibacteria bacterium]
MLILYISATVLVLFLVACEAILSFKANEIKKRQHFLSEALWKRRHLMPLLIESGSDNKDVMGAKEEIIRLRAEVSTEKLTLQEQIDIEKKLSHRIGDLLHKVEANKSLMTDAQFLSVKKEYLEALEQIEIAINDYNFSIREFARYVRFPWFWIFVFLSKVRFLRALESAQ